MRFTLRDLFAAVTFCAVVAWAAAQVGFDNWRFWFGVGISLLMASLFVWCARMEGKQIRGFLVIVPFGLWFLLISATPLAVEALILACAGFLFSSSAVPKRRDLCAIAVTAMLVGAAIAVFPSLSQVHQLHSLRSEYPAVPLRSRLEYETGHKAAPVEITALGSPVKEFLFAQESGFLNRSAAHFQTLYSPEYERAVRSGGFTWDKTYWPFRELDRPPVESLPFAAVDTLLANENFPIGTAFFRDFHEGVLVDFLDSRYFGAMIEPGKIAGFAPHAIHASSTVENAKPVAARRLLTTDHLELVSLLKFETPRVYVLDHLPRMDQLSSENAPTRPLDDFETKSLEQLRTKEDVVVEHTDDQYRMLGSLRAAKQCLDCHSAQRGELLGAFSYVLHEKAR